MGTKAVNRVTATTLTWMKLFFAIVGWGWSEAELEDGNGGVAISGVRNQNNRAALRRLLTKASALGL